MAILRILGIYVNTGAYPQRRHCWYTHIVAGILIYLYNNQQERRRRERSDPGGSLRFSNLEKEDERRG
jgi:hypothetical protein